MLVTASCGQRDETGQPDTPATSLEVTLWPEGREGGGGEHSATLTCAPTGGDHDQAEEACAALESHEDALEPVAADAMCTQIFGGPQEARVAGTVRGRAVDVFFNRRNGCEIDRWDRLAPLLEFSAGRLGSR